MGSKSCTGATDRTVKKNSLQTQHSYATLQKELIIL